MADIQDICCIYDAQLILRCGSLSMPTYLRVIPTLHLDTKFALAYHFLWLLAYGS